MPTMYLSTEAPAIASGLPDRQLWRRVPFAGSQESTDLVEDWLRIAVALQLDG
jgi:hypothetical protein